VLRLLQPPHGSFFLLGPRGTGKTTWLAQRFPDALRIDLLAPELLRSLQAHPGRLWQLVISAEAATVVIDAAQKAPALLEGLQGLIEARPELRFVVSGSSMRQLRDGGAHWRGEHLAVAAMPPFLAAELGEAFDLSRALAIGLLPSVWMAPDPATTLTTYAGLYLQDEVRAGAMVRQLGDFARFLEVISDYHGRQLKLAALARQATIPRKRAESYLILLEELLLGYRLPVFQGPAPRQLVQHPKFYFIDTGIYRALQHVVQQASGHDDSGQQTSGQNHSGQQASSMKPNELHSSNLQPKNQAHTVLDPSNLGPRIMSPSKFQPPNHKRRNHDPRKPLSAAEEIEAPALEGLVAQHLRALCQLRPGCASLTFWRTRAGLEVNFVLEGPELFLAIQVNRSAFPQHKDLAALKAFGQDNPEAQLLLLSSHPEPRRIDGIGCEPLEPWLRQLRP
jgi:predicted AAA+ superfamily ATPase